VINETLNAAFETDGFGTIVGLVLDRLGRAPEMGDQVTANGYLPTVERVEGARISTVFVREGDDPGDGPPE